jgi:NAD(P)-dependent dehydrogenase (short-subunit alcohol dehydrogenase family)
MLTETAIKAFAPGRAAIITGGASGIGLAMARQLAVFGMRVCIADHDRDALQAAVAQIATVAHNGDADVLAVEVDVSSTADIERLAESAFNRSGDIALLMNNAATFQGSDALSDADGWRRVLDVNVLGVLNGLQRIGRAMVDRGKPGFIVNTGSKQGITTPPGNTAYNASKAAVKALTEGLAHTLRNSPNCAISAHLVIPGFTYTGNAASECRTSQPPRGPRNR